MKPAENLRYREKPSRAGYGRLLNMKYRNCNDCFRHKTVNSACEHVIGTADYDLPFSVNKARSRHGDLRIGWLPLKTLTQSGLYAHNTGSEFRTGLM